MSDREDDFGFETEPDNQPPVRDDEEELTIGLSDDEDEDFTIGLADDEGEEFSLDSSGNDEPDFDLGPTDGEGSFSMESVDEETGFDQEPEEPATQDLFSLADEEPLTIIDEGPAEEMEPLFEQQVEASTEKNSSPLRLLLLVGVLVALGGAAFFFLGMPEDPPVRGAASVATKKQPIAKPEKPVIKPIAKAVPTVTVKSETPVSVEVKQPVAAVVLPPEKPAEVAKVAAPKPAPAAGNAKFQVRAGAFLLTSNLKEAEKQVEKLGFEPRRSETKKNMPMVRLKYGSYPRAEGSTKLAELKKTEPGAFVLYAGDKSTIYAGSYLSLDKARRHADQLWEKEIRVEEVKVDVDVPLHRLSFGRFADKASAEVAAQKARKAGLDAQVIAFKEP